jgi:DNA-directed RNA polymerase specialized sigma subunit
MRKYELYSKKRRESMTEKKILTEDILKVEEYLKGYSLNRKLVELEKYEKEYFGGNEAEWEEQELPAELPLARVRMFEIRHFVMGLPNCEEKLLLYYRYIKGESIESCAELLGVSRSTVYRIKDKALKLAARSF